MKAAPPFLIPQSSNCQAAVRILECTTTGFSDLVSASSSMSPICGALDAWKTNYNVGLDQADASYCWGTHTKQSIIFATPFLNTQGSCIQTAKDKKDARRKEAVCSRQREEGESARRSSILSNAVARPRCALHCIPLAFPNTSGEF